MKPNVLLVVFDTARLDVCEPYGAAAGSTPALADLSRRGRALSHAYAPAPWTMPSHAAMFSGLLPRRLGLGQPPESGHAGVRAVLESISGRMLAPVLQRAGYRTLGFSTNLWVSRMNGFDIGFDDFQYVNSARDEQMNALLGQGRRAQLAWAREGLRARSDDGAEAVGRALRASIAGARDRPAFWFVNLVECHSPYLPPRPWNDLPAVDRIRAALDNKRYMSFESICLYAAGMLEVPAEAMQRLRHLYGRAVAYMDHWLAGVVEELDRQGILDETLVIVTSDHGENFGEGGLIAHGFSVDERLTRVPFVLAGPGADIPPDLFSLAALPRMVAQASGLGSHPWGSEDLPEGVAISQYDPMAPADSERAQANAQRYGIDAAGVERLCATLTSVTDGRHKLVIRDGREQVYDLAGDPGEQDPLDPAAAGDDQTLSKLRAALAHPALAGAEAAPAAPDGPQSGAAASADEVAEIERKMQLLGYM